MKNSNPALNAVAAIVRKSDKIWAKDSAVVRLAKRASILDVAPESRHAAYPLGWLVDTGRLSAEIERALLSLSARDFAATALTISASGASVRACADAWIAAAHA